MADNVSASLGSDGGKPSACGWVDVLRLEFARVASSAGLQEVFTPAQHDTGWVGPLAEWQAHCDVLAKGSGQAPVGRGYPCPELLRDSALFFLEDRLVLSLQVSLDAVYDRLAAGRLGPARPPCTVPLSWAAVVEQGLVAARGLRLAYWLRGAPLLHWSSRADLPCPLCGVLCEHWGLHLWDACALDAGAALRGFRAIMAHLSRTCAVVWHSAVRTSTVDAHAGCVHWRLARDDEAGYCSGAATISWSGLLYADCCLIPTHRAATLVRTFLDAAGMWVDLDGPLRWMSLVTGVPPISAPADVIGPHLPPRPRGAPCRLLS